MRAIVAIGFAVFAAGALPPFFLPPANSQPLDGKTAQALDVDWKVYGSASVDWHNATTKGDSASFYDAKGVVRRSDGHIRVWTKCLLYKDMDSIDTKKDPGKTILENSAQKVARYYVPPIAMVDKSIDAEKAAAIAWREESANLSNIEPVARIFYEINCSEGMSQELSMAFRNKNGKYDYRDKPLDWKYIAPESNIARLQKILCPRE
jgi:hypothetical protein